MRLRMRGMNLNMSILSMFEDTFRLAYVLCYVQICYSDINEIKVWMKVQCAA